MSKAQPRSESVLETGVVLRGADPPGLAGVAAGLLPLLPPLEAGRGEGLGEGRGEGLGLPGGEGWLLA